MSSASDPKLVSDIVPSYATGTWIGLSGAGIYVAKDGTARIVVAEEDMSFEDDSCEGPDGPEGGVQWVCRLSLGEIECLRDALNGLEFEGEKEARLSGENGRLEYEVGRLTRDLMAEQEKSRRQASALEAAEARIAARIAALEAENGALREERDKAWQYAKEATHAITSLTAGGSEYFGRRMGGFYTADLPFCVERIRETKTTLFNQLEKAIRGRRAAEAEVAALRQAEEKSDG